MKKSIRTASIGIFMTSLILLIHSKGYSQISLSYDEFSVFFKPEKSIDTFEFKLTTQYYFGYTLKIYLKTFGGEAFVKLYNKKHQLKITGNFVNGPDTLMKYKYSLQVGPPVDKQYTGINLIKYLSPLRKGIWTYYNDHGKIIERREYDYRFW